MCGSDYNHGKPKRNTFGLDVAVEQQVAAQSPSRILVFREEEYT
jgi:hypothetical protein